MDSQNKTYDEHMFFRLEMRCREVETTLQFESKILQPLGWLLSLPSRLFRWTSNYGWSMGRPIAAVILLIVACAFAFQWLEVWRPGDADDPLTLGQSFGLSLANTFSFLGLGRTFLAEEFQTLTLTSEILSGVQRFLGPVFLFLFGLALRNRFRMR